MITKPSDRLIEAVARPMAVMSFDRPHYLEPVLRSLKAQTVPISSDQIFLFQDGYRGKNGGDLTDPRLVERCVELFQTIFPGAKTFVTTENLGVARNFSRAESYLFDELGAEAGYFFEDDLTLSPQYLAVLNALTDIALREKRIAYVAAYGDHKAKLSEQRRTPNKLIPMRHKWGFATTRRQWAAQHELLGPYLDIVSRDDYRARDHTAIRAYFGKLGYGSTGTSQDAMKDVASHVLGTTKIMTFACLAKYIGEIGLHSKKDIYDEEGFAHTEIYAEKLTSFEPPSSKQLDEWIAVGRTNGKKALALADTNASEKTDCTRETSVDLEEKFARALYRVFLLREPDVIGLGSVLRQLRSGRSFEEVMRWCLCSEEFAQKHRQFLRTYLPPDLPVSAAADANAPQINRNRRHQSAGKAKR